MTVGQILPARFVLWVFCNRC